MCMVGFLARFCNRCLDVTDKEETKPAPKITRSHIYGKPFTPKKTQYKLDYLERMKYLQRTNNGEQYD